MQKELFQEYLYNKEKFKSADLSELESLVEKFPWFSTAAIMLLNSSKIQGDPNFGSLLKRLSISIPNRRFIQRSLQNEMGSKTISQPVIENAAVDEETHSRIPGILDIAEESKLAENSTQPENEVLKSFEEDALLDFAYTSKNENPDHLVDTVSGNNVTEEIDTPAEDLKGSGQQNFDRWISKLGGDSKVEKSPFKKQGIIESFIHSDPGVIRADKETRLEGDVAGNSAEEHEGFITDTLAKIYLKQGLYNKAIYAYEKLCLKYPEKSIYFVTQIEEIRSLYIKK